SVTGLTLTPDAGNVTVTVPNGFLASAAAAGPFGASIALPYTGGKLAPTNFTVRFQPAAARAYAGTMIVAPASGNAKNVTLSGSGLAAPAGVEESVVYPLTANTSCSSATGFSTCTPEAVT